MVSKITAPPTPQELIAKVNELAAQRWTVNGKATGEDNTLTLTPGDLGAEAAGAAVAVQTALDAHTADGTGHITSQERADWNSRATAEQGAKADNALPRSGGALEGPVTAQVNTSYQQFQLRGLALGTELPASIANGQIFFQY